MIRKCILYERACVVRKDGPAGVIFYNPPRIVGVRPFLNFAAPEAENAEHYQSECRLALLAYAAFPNAYWNSAAELREVRGERRVGLFPAFVSEEQSPDRPHPAEEWGDFPSFARPQWGSAKNREKM